MLESLQNNVFTYKKLTEEEQAQRNILGRLVGVIADTKRPTRNGRQYSKSLWENVFNDPIMQEKIEHRCCFGEFGHPADREEVDPEKIAICLAEKPKLGNDGLLYGVFDILNTPCGKILKCVCDYGTDVGVSSRGSGDVLGDDEVDPETYNCECWDAVLIPAVKSARLKNVNESLDTNKLKLRRALNEELDRATDEDKKVMKDVLEELNINVNECNEDVEDEFVCSPLNLEGEEKPLIEEEEIENEENNEEEKECSVEDIINLVKDVAAILVDPLHEDDAIENLVAEKVDSGEYDEETLNEIIDAVKDIVSDCSAKNETIDDEVEAEPEADSVDEDEIEVEDENEEVADSETDEVIENLKEAIRQKDELENEIKSLKNEKTVSDAEVNELKEELNKYKVAFMRTSEIAANGKKAEANVKKLTEQLNQQENVLKQKDNEIISLKKSQANAKLTESADSANANKVKVLTERLNASRKEVESKDKQLTEQVEAYNKKLNKVMAIAKGYKSKADSTLIEYVNFRASMLGIDPKNITNKLAESYTVADVNKVCDNILSKGMPQMPYSSSIKPSRITESVKNEEKIPEDLKELYELAGLI